MKRDVQRIVLAAIIPLFLLFILYILKFLETGMDWDFTKLGVYPMEKRGVFGIFAHPLVHSSFKHLFANTIPFFFLSWCLFYFYRDIAPYIFFTIWIGCGVFTFLIGKPGWHIGASGIIYGLAFFLFFSGFITKTRTTHSNFSINNFSVWRIGMEHVSTVRQRNDLLGRTSQRCHNRNALFHRFYEIRSSTSGTFRRRGRH